MLPPYIHLYVNMVTAEVSEYFKLDYDLRLKSFTPGLPKGTAIEVAKKAILEDLNNPYGKHYRRGDPGQLRETFLVVATIPAYRDKPLVPTQALMWEIRFNGKEKAMGREGDVWVPTHWTVQMSAIGKYPAIALTTGPHIDE